LKPSHSSLFGAMFEMRREDAAIGLFWRRLPGDEFSKRSS
jgi:hypothetical protein